LCRSIKQQPEEEAIELLKKFALLTIPSPSDEDELPSFVKSEDLLAEGFEVEEGGEERPFQFKVPVPCVGEVGNETIWGPAECSGRNNKRFVSILCTY
jgi:hypothetical protein